MTKPMTVTDTDKFFGLAENLALEATANPRFIQKYKLFTVIASIMERGGFFRRSKGLTQAELIYNHIKKCGSISQREAYLEYNIQSFHRRLSDLRELGHVLVPETKNNPITGQTYTRYSIEGMARDEAA